ncbi:RNA polymerase sigma factor [Hydrogenoanaerobacterium sp.]|uniref:RNA polymerase sigma factor n=1 Tax=Hydrogenoanaerobacterium sp. TaxID=2953763 RepID=UPI00289C29F8|nr:RNA polymerase sigma factor [Hydrogenoanaerobacterium sp.]
MLLFCLMSTDQDKKRNRAVPQLLDEGLIARVGNNDGEAFRALYCQTDRAVYGFALSILKNQQDAEDVMQDTYLKIRASAHLYQPRGKPMAWVLTITKNLARMKLRSKATVPCQPIEELDNRLDFSCVTNQEDRLVLEAALTLLKEDERQIVLLHALTGLRHREIAQLLEMPLATVLSKYNRSLKKLRQYLTKEEGTV